MPSTTAKTGGSRTKVSSLCRRLRPVSETAAGRPDRRSARDCTALGRKDEALLREPQIPHRRAHDAPDEEVEHDEEDDLEEKENLLDGHGREGHGPSRLKTSSVVPIVTRSPSA